ncbi:pirin family protein [Herbiconiux sp. 11R-BC]|uniref:pirin family protein n=1 Tax=Herbiconiux sp. 11R-BC TaxID=3111637 RepID=UPI003C05175E
MSNLEKQPAETWAEPEPASAALSPHPEIITAREVPLGGPRAMTVHRTLPSKQRTLIGAWCFVDHYGPSDVSVTGGMVVPPHPHTGLQTVSWLFEGEIEHRDSVGSHSFVRPGELNLMTAGRGISHSEISTEATTTLHGVQLWVALPEHSRRTEPFFETHAAVPLRLGAADIRVFVGELGGASVGATTFTPLVAAEIRLSSGGRTEIPLRPDFEYGVLVDTGAVTIDGSAAIRTELAYLGPGRTSVKLSTGQSSARLLLIGGAPFGEQVLMWWNFVGRSHDEVAEYRAQWQQESGAEPATDAPTPTTPDAAARPGRRARHARPRFGETDHHYAGDPLPAPELPTVRLKPRP